MNAFDLKPHALAAIVPDMLRDEYTDLVADIRKNGLRQPIVLFEGRVLDGRHRLRGCIEANVPIRTDEFQGTRAEAKTYVLSLNCHRRHLSYTQKQKIVASELKRDPAQSDRTIAKKAMVDHKTVKAARGRAEANGEIPQKSDRTEVSGRRARGRKPGVPATHPRPTQITADGPLISVADAAPSANTVEVTANSGSVREISPAIPNKRPAEGLERSRTAEPRSVATMAHADSIKVVMESIRDTFALADVAMIAAACVARLLAAKIPSHILRRSGLNAVATELELATPKLRRRVA